LHSPLKLDIIICLMCLLLCLSGVFLQNSGVPKKTMVICTKENELLQTQNTNAKEYWI